MLTAALLLAGVIIDVSLLHWAIITVTVIAITAAICYHDVHVVVTMRMSFDVVSLRLSSGTSSSTTMTDDTDDVHR